MKLEQWAGSCFPQRRTILANVCLEGDPLVDHYIDLHPSAQTSTHNKACVQYVVLRSEVHTATRLQTAGHHPVSPVFWWEGLLAWQVCFLGNGLPSASQHLQIHLRVLRPSHPAWVWLTATTAFIRLSRKSQLLPLKGFPAYLAVDWLTSCTSKQTNPWV